MAGEDDDSQKTEEPTGKRLSDAREKGQVARSQEVSHWFMILALALVVGIFAPSFSADLGGALRPFLERPHLMPLEDGGLRNLLLGAATTNKSRSENSSAGRAARAREPMITTA